MFDNTMTIPITSLSLFLLVAFPVDTRAADCGRQSLGTQSGKLTGLTTADGSTGVELLAQDDQVELCVQTPHCAWKAAAVSSALLEEFADQVTGDSACPPTVERYSIVDRTVVSRCALPTDLRGALQGADAIVSHVFPSAQCGRPGEYLADRARVVLADGKPVFLADLALPTICGTLGVELTGQRRFYFAFQQACPQSENDAAEMALRWTGSTTPALKAVSIGSISNDFAFGITSADTTLSKSDDVEVFAWGKDLDEGYVKQWLTAVKSAAFSNRPQGDAPIIPGDETPTGKLSRWLAAAASRMDAKLFDGTDPKWIASSQARDWMTKTYLSSPDDLEGTIFRVENARKPESQQ
jgi:hypothetical protein